MHDWSFVADHGPDNRQFLRAAWYQAWDSAYGDERNWSRPVRYISLSGGPTTHGIFPFATQRVGPFQFASLCGTFLPFRGVPYCGDPAALAAPAVDALQTMGPGIGIRLSPIPATDPLLRALLAEFGRKGWRTMCRDVGSEFIIANPGSAEIYAAALSSKRRHHVGYYWRKLCKEGPTEIRHFNGCSPNDWKGVFHDIRIVEAASWVAQSGEPRFTETRNTLFWETLTNDAWFRQAIHVWLIYHAGEAVSFAVALDAGRTRYVFANSFDARFAKFSTGAKIYHELICDAFSRGIAHINIGLGDSGYKLGWGAQASSDLLEVVAFVPGWSGAAAYLAAQAREFTTPTGRRKSRSLAAVVE